MIVFTYDKNIWASENNEWGGIVDSIKKIVDGSANMIASKIGGLKSSFQV
jgi:hypothetical protein